MKKLMALLLAVCLLAGCQLASEEKNENRMEDQLVGVFVTFDHMDLEFDIEGWLEDNPGALKDGDVTLEYGEGMEYAGKLPVTAGEYGWEVPGFEGLSMGRFWNGEYWTGFSAEGICELNSKITDGDDGDTVDVEGTVYFPADTEVMLCTNPVYMTAEGEYYVVQGQSFHSYLGYGAMSQSVSDEKTWNENGVETRYFAKFTTTVQGVTPAELVRFVWMSADHRELSRAEYAPDELPASAVPTAGAAYLIVETIAGNEITRSLNQPGDDAIRIFCQGEQPWCLPRFAEILWNE